MPMSCEYVLDLVQGGALDSHDVKLLVNKKYISPACGRQAISKIRLKIQMNGRRERESNPFAICKAAGKRGRWPAHKVESCTRAVKESRR
jgi:hypothetical protein